MDYSLCNNNWCSYVKQIFNSCNLDDFDNQSICSLDICKMKLQCIECSEWKKKLNSKPKLRTYKQFKSEKQIENDIKLNLSNKEIVQVLRGNIVQICLQACNLAQM